MHAMFVRYFVEVPLPAAVVETALLDAQPGWLSAMAGEAQTRGDELLGAVGVGPRLGRRVAIALGEPVRFPSMTSLPLTWEPVALEGLLPRVTEATLKDFLDRLGAAITLSQPGPAARMPP
jgi:hypothetical protein